MTAFGATLPLGRASAKDGCPVLCRPSSSRPTDLRSGKPPEGQLDGGEGNEDGQGFAKVLEILGKTPFAPEPRESALDQIPVEVVPPLRRQGTGSQRAGCPLKR